MTSDITIEGDEPWFSENKKESRNPTSIGYYLIAVHSYEDVEFAITVKTVPNQMIRNSSSIEVLSIFQGL